jgi:hypothetical protein
VRGHFTGNGALERAGADDSRALREPFAAGQAFPDCRYILRWIFKLNIFMKLATENGGVLPENFVLVRDLDARK